jgi:hypothetical protein
MTSGAKLRSWPVRVCVYCGMEANTRDHIPPKALFLRPYPNFITVPACTSCNHKFSAELDERFRNIIALRAGGFTPAGTMLWKSKGLRSLLRNRREFEEYRRTWRIYPVTAADGGYVGHVAQFAFNALTHDESIQRLVRGFYYHRFGCILEPTAGIGVTLVDQQKPGWRERLAEELRPLVKANVGGERTFEYAFGRMPDRHDTSIWVFSFYNSHFAVGYTGMYLERW